MDAVSEHGQIRGNGLWGKGMEANTGTAWNTSIRSTLFGAMVGVAVSLRQNECQGGRGQLSLAVKRTRRQMVDGMEDGSSRRERGRSKIPLKCNLDMC